MTKKKKKQKKKIDPSKCVGMSFDGNHVDGSSSFGRPRYLCEKTEKWIRNNIDLVEMASVNKCAFAELIQKLQNDKELQNNEGVFVYDDLCRKYWGPDHVYGIEYRVCGKVGFFGDIFMCDPDYI